VSAGGDTEFRKYCSTAYVSCAIEGTTFAYCYAKETITAQGTLALKDLNWMHIPLTQMPSPPPTLQPSVTPVASEIIFPDFDSFTLTSWIYLVCLAKLSSLLGFLSIAGYALFHLL